MTDETLQPRVLVDGIGRRYDTPQGSVQALQDVTFDVSAGEFVCIVGPSGSGKTTLFRIIAGLEPATTGTVYLGGDPVEGPGPELGLVFQEYHLFPWRTVSGNVGFGLEKQGVNSERRQQRVDELLELVGLDGFADSYPRDLSGGMKQRVALARALAVNPDLLLMDEPFGAVDAQTKRMLQDELLDIWSETGKTILFVTHDVEEAVKLADQVIVMASEPGRIREIVEVDMDRPRSRSDAEFGDYYERILGLIQS
ncbi:ABC transporter ATP-binding protein [Haloarcula marismortui]|uniref:Molybdate/tungstate import ATP-binding protein WtpC n=1 Tax=Haloarcula marismortui ATCC 33800 TaxID=662476 RepID=M0JK84_9EURY|nr:ABC transporter ATP-binding protein [Haloarcula sinaiiensis]EMA09522.1 putative sulfonate ABC transporter ATP-binding protein [Haloarcula sinaiiensis ATCC 33800]QUJ74296.1 ABC transporter ATP-binding protein [Haloarcula sinaiiensis ATCC 33800]